MRLLSLSARDMARAQAAEFVYVIHLCGFILVGSCITACTCWWLIDSFLKKHTAMTHLRSACCSDTKYLHASFQSCYHTVLHSTRATTHPANYLAQPSKSAYHSTSKYKNTKNSLHGRTAMITGGSSGIGYAIAERFLEEGASKVILVGRRLEKLQNASKQLSKLIYHDPSHFGDRDGEIATRAPEDDESEFAATTVASRRIGYVVGDVSMANEWMGELEKEMVSTFSPLPVSSY